MLVGTTQTYAITMPCCGIGIGANRWHLLQPSNGAGYSAALYTYI